MIWAKKSAYTKCLADQVDMPLIIKRASDHLGSYVGETERNVAGAFDEVKEKRQTIDNRIDHFCIIK